MIYDHDPWRSTPYAYYQEGDHAGVEPPPPVRAIEVFTCLNWGGSGMRALLSGQLGTTEPYHGNYTETGRRQGHARAREEGRKKRPKRQKGHAHASQARSTQPAPVAPGPPARDWRVGCSSMCRPEPVEDTPSGLGGEDWPKSYSVVVTNGYQHIDTRPTDSRTLYVPWPFSPRRK